MTEFRLKRELIQKLMIISIGLLMKVFQKNVMAVLYFFIIKTILTIENGSVKDAIKSY